MEGVREMANGIAVLAAPGVFESLIAHLSTVAGELCQETLNIPKNAEKEPPFQKPSKIYHHSHSAIPSFSRSLFVLTVGVVETIHFYVEHRRLRAHNVLTAWHGFDVAPGMAASA